MDFLSPVPIAPIAVIALCLISVIVTIGMCVAVMYDAEAVTKRTVQKMLDGLAVKIRELDLSHLNPVASSPPRKHISKRRR